MNNFYRNEKEADIFDGVARSSASETHVTVEMGDLL